MRRALFIPVIVLSLGACQTIPEADNAASIGVNFDFEARHACKNYGGPFARTSPKISLTGVPAETKHLAFTMVDLDYPPFNHGSETIEYKQAIIPEGALKTYIGPCPPRPHRYKITFKALNADKALVLGKGEATRVWPK